MCTVCEEEHDPLYCKHRYLQAEQFTDKKYMVNDVESLTKINEYAPHISISLKLGMYTICEINECTCDRASGFICVLIMKQRRLKEQCKIILNLEFFNCTRKQVRNRNRTQITGSSDNRSLTDWCNICGFPSARYCLLCQGEV